MDWEYANRLKDVEFETAYPLLGNYVDCFAVDSLRGFWESDRSCDDVFPIDLHAKLRW